MTPAADGNGAGAPRRWRWLWTALIISLGLNLLVVGLVAGTGWRRWHDDGRRHFSLSRSLERLSEQVPTERRATVAQSLERYRSDVKPRWQAVRQAREDLMRTLEADPYDEAAARAAVERLNGAQLDARQRLSQVMLDLMRSLTPEERRFLMRELKQRRPSRDDKDGGRRSD